MLHINIYGQPRNGMLFDDQSLKGIERILKREYTGPDLLLFYTDLLELSNFCDIFCLYDQLFKTFDSQPTDECREKQEIKLRDFDFGTRVADLLLFTIDDMQMDRLALISF